MVTFNPIHEDAIDEFVQKGIARNSLVEGTPHDKEVNAKILQDPAAYAAIHAGLTPSQIAIIAKNGPSGTLTGDKAADAFIRHHHPAEAAAYEKAHEKKFQEEMKRAIRRSKKPKWIRNSIIAVAFLAAAGALLTPRMHTNLGAENHPAGTNPNSSVDTAPVMSDYSNGAPAAEGTMRPGDIPIYQGTTQKGFIRDWTDLSITRDGRPVSLREFLIPGTIPEPYKVELKNQNTDTTGEIVVDLTYLQSLAVKEYERERGAGKAEPYLMQTAHDADIFDGPYPHKSGSIQGGESVEIWNAFDKGSNEFYEIRYHNGQKGWMRKEDLAPLPKRSAYPSPDPGSPSPPR